MATNVYEDLSAEVPQRKENAFFPSGEGGMPFTGREKELTVETSPEEEKQNVYPGNGLSPTPYNARRAGRAETPFSTEKKSEYLSSPETTYDRKNLSAPGRMKEDPAGDTERETDFTGLRAMARLYGDLAGFSKRDEGTGNRSGGDPLSEKFRGRINRSTEPEALHDRIRTIRRNGWRPYTATGQRPSLYEGTEGGKPSLYE